MSMGEVATVREVQSKDGVSRLQDCAVRLHVGGGTGVRLHIRMLGAEQLLGALARQVLYHVRELASAVVTLSGISFGVLVGKHRPHGFEHSFAYKVLGSDQFQALMLAARFVIDSSGDIGINGGKRTGHPVRHESAPEANE